MNLFVDPNRLLFQNFGKHQKASTQIIQAPLSSERFEAGVVSAMQKKEDPRSHQPLCDNLEPGQVVALGFCKIK